MLAVDDPEPLYSSVLIEGTAELGTNLDEVIALATRLGGRYMVTTAPLSTAPGTGCLLSGWSG
jgi:hypothetical protein